MKKTALLLALGMFLGTAFAQAPKTEKNSKNRKNS